MGAFVGAYNKGRSPVIGPSVVAATTSGLYVLLIVWGIEAGEYSEVLSAVVGSPTKQAPKPGR
jgi:hypothetical protein